MSVTLNFPLGYDHHGQKCLYLIRATDDNENELEVDEMCLMHSSDRFHVFSGSLVVPKGSHWQHLVCKIAYTEQAIERIEREFLIYEALKHLQGKVVPRCFGYFEEPGEAGCIILEYAGEELNTCFDHAPQDIKLKILDAYVQIHDAGVKHRDVTEDNVLIHEDGRVSIIDFEGATKMRCRRIYSVPSPGEIGPNERVFGCQELCDVGYELEIWKPSIVMVYGYPTPISAFNDRQALLARRPSHYSEYHAYQEMHRSLMSYTKKYWPDVYAQIPQDGRYYWPEILMDDSPDPVDEDLGVKTSDETRSDPLVGDGPDTAREGSSDSNAVIPSA